MSEPKEITLESKTAATILAHAHNMNVGVLKAVLGEGYAIALKRQWLVPDMETGNVAVNHNPGVRRDLEAEAAKVPVVEDTAKKPGKIFRIFSTSRVSEATDASFPARDDVDVGGEVLVADAGQTYQAKVASRNSDGTYTLSFGDKKPANVGRRYRREELNHVKPGAPVERGGPPAAGGDVRGQGVQAATALGVSA